MIIRVDDRTAIYGEKQMTWKGSCGKMVIAAEGGIAHGVGIAKFIIVWDEEGNSRVDKWWVEPWE